MLLYYCCAEFAGFSVSEVHCELDAARSHDQVSAPPAQEEEASQHQCPVSGNFNLNSLHVTHKAKHTLQQQLNIEQTLFPCFLQTSLTKLLETLNRAEPFFIRCIRSNAEKVRLLLLVIMFSLISPLQTFGLSNEYLTFSSRLKILR